jgi:hypothetical protein
MSPRIDRVFCSARRRTQSKFNVQHSRASISRSLAKRRRNEVVHSFFRRHSVYDLIPYFFLSRSSSLEWLQRIHATTTTSEIGLNRKHLLMSCNFPFLLLCMTIMRFQHVFQIFSLSFSPSLPLVCLSIYVYLGKLRHAITCWAP